MSVWIINGSVWDKASGSLQKKHIRLEGEQIAEIVDGSAAPDTGSAEVIDAAGKLVSAGFIDMHVHLRDPGFEYKEDIATGTRSAAKGGFTTIACMPNTRPAVDTPETVKYILDKNAAEGVVKVLPYAAITKNQLGRELTDFAALKEAGAIGFTDDGVGVQSAQMMKDAMALAESMNMPIIAHCEDNTLVEGLYVSEGSFSRKHGLKGIPNESEAIHVGRDVLLSEATGAHYHVCHVSTEQSVRLIRLAKQIGVRVTAEVCPHHLVLSDEDIPGFDSNWKMNPPLRTPRDVEAVIEALEDGTIDMIVTDHAPHSAEEKARDMQLAPFGIVGFETAFPLLYTKFVQTGKWTLGFLLDRMTADPARVFGLPTGRIKAGAPADLTIVDLDNERAVDPSTFASKSNNTPFGGWKLQGWPVATIVDGKIVYNESAK
ncbi:dihydroorotase [Paenibacillus sp. JDR-2]|uniref:dihydroorotase n=1 Tax=Paenibacillus sp. (strain JDR-2) TaxID=324057 RepID=UPI000166B745|nr:dihydroorotase [Paenibacillus sp. JDR-2]ACT02493.1 dihydroorotase, multifunctional complex type [Paenibacillus sp. JDR-2]